MKYEDGTLIFSTLSDLKTAFGTKSLRRRWLIVLRRSHRSECVTTIDEELLRCRNV